MTAAGQHGAPAPGLAWEWDAALLGALFALPAAVLVVGDATHGLALAVGAIPAAIVGMAPQRRRRLAIVAVGLLAALSIFTGGLLAEIPVAAVAAIFLLGVGAVLLAQRAPLGQVAMVLALPMVGIGLSFADAGQAAGLGALMIAGSVWAWLVTLPWPDRPPPPRAAGRPAPPTLGYGLRLGAAGASAAAIGFLADFQHVGWACAAALLVMRPKAEMQRLRSVGRIAAVAVGALAAVAFVRVQPDAGWYAVAVVAAIAGASATHRSRWYVTAGFTTYLVFLLLLHSDPGDASFRFFERLGETVLGVGLAYLFGLLLPALMASRSRSHPPPAL